MRSNKYIHFPPIPTTSKQTQESNPPKFLLMLLTEDVREEKKTGHQQMVRTE